MRSYVIFLEPFWHQTNILQSDSTSLSLAIPSILELVCHLTNFKQQKQTARAAKAMLDLEKRNPLPAAACLCDPQVVGIIIAEQPILLEAAKKFVAEEICRKVHLNRRKQQIETETDQANLASTTPALSASNVAPQSGAGAEGRRLVVTEQGNGSGIYVPNLATSTSSRFKLLSAKITAAASLSHHVGTQDDMETAIRKIDQYVAEITSSNSNASQMDAIKFWKERVVIYGDLAFVALDMVSAPASQAYVERIFSVCGILTAGRRNRMAKSLSGRVFLRLNKTALSNKSQ